MYIAGVFLSVLFFPRIQFSFFSCFFSGKIQLGDEKCILARICTRISDPNWINMLLLHHKNCCTLSAP